MGMFFNVGDVEPSIEECFKDPNEVMELFILDEVSHLSDEQIQEFCKPGGVGEQLVQEGKFKRNTLVKLSKKDDLSRRETMLAMQMAKDANDTLWKKYIINRQRSNQLKAAMKKKYANKAARAAKVAQNEFIHGGAKKKGVLPKSFMRAGGNDRVSEDD